MFDDRDAFVRFMNEDQPVRPANIINIVGINQGKRPFTMGKPTTQPMNPQQFSAKMNQGILVVDTRDAATYGAGHVPGAYNIQLTSSEFEQRVGWVTPLDAPMLLILEDDKMIDHALHLLAFLGLDQRVKGYLAGGMKAWLNDGLPHTTIPQISVHELNKHLQNGINMKVLDVRETSEWDDGHIQNAHYMNYKYIADRLGEITLAKNEHISVLCARGMRSSTATSILTMNGYEKIYNVTGGMTAWAAAGFPMIDASGKEIYGARPAKPEWFEL